MPEAYETHLHDVLIGDQTVFVHADEVTESWRLYTPLLDKPSPLRSYPSGGWGPKQADELMVSEETLWR